MIVFVSGSYYSTDSGKLKIYLRYKRNAKDPVNGCYNGYTDY